MRKILRKSRELETQGLCLTLKRCDSVIEGLAKPAQLDDHPLASAQFVTDYLRKHPDKQPLPPGKRLGWALADRWLNPLPTAAHRPGRLEWMEYLPEFGGRLLLSISAQRAVPWQTGPNRPCAL